MANGRLDLLGQRRSSWLRRAMLTASVALLGGLPAPSLVAPAYAGTLADLGNRIPNGRLVWSRGGRLYYSSIANFSPKAVTYLDGAGAEKPAIGTHPRWSPDGKQLLYLDTQGVQLMSASFPAARTQVIKHGHDASWTRDGKAITAVSAAAPCSDYCVVKYTLGNKATATIYDSRTSGYNGQKIGQAAELRRGGRFLLVWRELPEHATEIVDLSTKKYYANQDMLDGDCSPAWAPDGSYIVQTARESSRPVRRTLFNANTPSVSSTTAYYLKLPTSSRYYIHNGRLSNDGKWILGAAKYLSGGHADRELYIRSLADQVDAVTRLTNNQAEDEQPSLYIGDPPPDPRITLAPTSLSFSGQQGQADPSSERIVAKYLDGASAGSRKPEISYAGSASGWLTVALSGSGTARTLTNTVELAGLSPSNYSATVKVFAERAVNSPQTYVVTLGVAKPAEQPDAGVGDGGVSSGMALAPSQIEFGATVQQPAPATQQVALSIDPAGEVALDDVQTEVAYAGDGGWLKLTVQQDGDQFAIANDVDHAGLPANRYVATVSVSASGTDNSPQSYVVMLDVATRPSPDAGVPDTNWPDASWELPDAGTSGDAGSSAPRSPLDDQRVALSGGCEVGTGSAPIPTATLLMLALALAWRRRRGRGQRS